MIRCSYRTVALSYAAAFLLVTTSFFFESCSTTASISRSEKVPAPIPKKENSPGRILPDGWEDITDRSRRPQILLWFINSDYSGTITLREFQTDDSLLAAQSRDNPCLLAEISLRMKFSDGGNGKRVTRTPARIDSLKDVCGYVYAENELLRKVLVFEYQSRLYELELLQERPDASFDKMSDDQLQILESIIGDSH